MSTQTMEQTQAAWDALAAGYDEFVTPHNFTYGQDALRRVGLRGQMRFLDVAAGSGALAIPAARIGADVVAVDLSPRMIERLTTRARRERLSNLEARVMDGHALELPDAAFDVAASQNGVSLLPDLPRGLGELVRVTKPAGRVLLIAFGAPRKAEFLGFFFAALQAAAPGFTAPPMDPPPLPFQVADPTVMRRMLTEAGLREVTVEPVTWEMPFESATQFWNVVTSSNPIGAALVADLPSEHARGVRHVLDGMLRERSDGGSTARLHAEVNIGIGVK